MNRRNFLSLISAGVAGIALEQAIPLGRVWSFPKKIVIAKPAGFIGVDWGYGIDRGVYLRTSWRRSPDGKVYSRHETFERGEWRQTLDWHLTAEPRIPILTAAFPPDSSRTPS